MGALGERTTRRLSLLSGFGTGDGVIRMNSHIRFRVGEGSLLASFMIPLQDLAAEQRQIL